MPVKPIHIRHFTGARPTADKQIVLALCLPACTFVRFADERWNLDRGFYTRALCRENILFRTEQDTIKDAVQFRLDMAKDEAGFCFPQRIRAEFSRYRSPCITVIDREHFSRAARKSQCKRRRDHIGGEECVPLFARDRTECSRPGSTITRVKQQREFVTITSRPNPWTCDRQCANGLHTRVPCSDRGQRARGDPPGRNFQEDTLHLPARALKVVEVRTRHPPGPTICRIKPAPGMQEQHSQCVFLRFVIHPTRAVLPTCG